LAGDAPEPGFCNQAIWRAIIEERIIVALCAVACKIMLGRAQPIAFVCIVQRRYALVPQVGRLGPGLLPNLLQGWALWAIERAQARYAAAQGLLYERDGGQPGHSSLSAS
jgi:hypothetical protein